MAGAVGLPVMWHGGVPLLPPAGAAAAGWGRALPVAGSPGGGVVSPVERAERRETNAFNKAAYALEAAANARDKAKAAYNAYLAAVKATDAARRASA